jgi:hypothetical protein
MKTIGKKVFYNCGLTSVTIPNSVTSIEENAFYGCSDLTSVSIPNSVTSIGSQAFSWCQSLTSITIPESLKSIGEYAFYGCPATTVTNLAQTPQEISYEIFSEYGTLHVRKGCKAAYEAVEFWKNFTIVEDATTGIDAMEGSATISEDKIFSIFGQRLDKTAKGVNIINGKKVLVK